MKANLNGLASRFIKGQNTHNKKYRIAPAESTRSKLRGKDTKVKREEPEVEVQINRQHHRVQRLSDMWSSNCRL